MVVVAAALAAVVVTEAVADVRAVGARAALRSATLCGVAWLAACGGDPTAPTLSALSLDPATGVPPGGLVKVGANYDDEDEDLPGGTAEVALRRTSEPRGRTFTSPIGGGPSAIGRLVVSVTLPAGLVPGTYELGLTAVDQAGRRSNALTTSLEVIE